MEYSPATGSLANRGGRLRSARVRTSAVYELVEHIAATALEAGDTDILHAVRSDAKTAAFLRPKPGSLRTVKAIGSSLAGLLRTLSDVGPAGGFAGAEVDEESLARLIADDILELHEGGQWKSGPEAAIGTVGEPQSSPAALVSRNALLRVALAGPRSLGQTAAALYHHHRLPHSPRHVRRFPDRNAVERVLGLACSQSVRSAFEAHGAFVPALHGADDWLLWLSHSVAPATPRYKVYVSLLPEDMARALPIIGEAALEANVARMKIACSPDCMLRPDRLMLYTASREKQQRIGATLSSVLRELRPHGVPFATPVDPDGRVALADDGPDRPGTENESARLRTCRQLASALVNAFERGEPPEQAARQAALRVYLEGEEVALQWAPGWQ